MNPLSKLVRLRFGLPHVRRADTARDHSRWIEAVVDYSRGLGWMPWRDDLKIQIGNCLKEFGDYEGAVRAYASVKAAANVSEARKQTSDAVSRSGGTMLPFLVAEKPSTAAGAAPADATPAFSPRYLPNRLRPVGDRSPHWLGSLQSPRDGRAMARRISYAAIKLSQVGTFLLDRDGVQEPFVAGVFADPQLDGIELWIGEGKQARLVETAPLHRMKAAGTPLKLYVFNVWIDSARLPTGRQWLSVRTGGTIKPAGLFLTVSHKAGDTPNELAASDSFIASPTVASNPIDEAVLAIPAQRRDPQRSVFSGPIRSILAIRADQLGDVSASLPALRRLRTLFPDARLVALVQPGVRAIVEASSVVDEVMTLTLDYDAEIERRNLTQDEEERLAASLGQRRFDLAIDLSPGDESRPLLLLSGATFLVGFNPERHAFLDLGLSVRSRDKSNRLDTLPHAAAVLALIELLDIAMRHHWSPVRRGPDDVAQLEQIGLAGKPYVVVHAGARHPINCWPLANYAGLIDRVLEASACDVMFFGKLEDASPLLDNPRVHAMGLIEPDLFDAAVSNARVMIGNDSGPKHLAAMRGVPTVSIHVNRLNWNEWGQVGTGAILSKRVPCAGCGLNDIELCGRDAICIRSITVEEVWAAVEPYLASDPGRSPV